MARPNFFIVGKPKSGSTALHQMLAEHPGIYMSARKEPHHFHLEHMESGLRRKRGYNGLPFRDRNNYLQLFSASGDAKVVGESSTGYLYSRSAAREIAAFNPGARILMCFREPVEFLYSFHSQLLRSANESEPDFEAALALEDDRKRGKAVPSTATYPENLFYSEHIKYLDQAARFFECFPSEQIKVLIYEDFRDDNPGVYQSVLEFLDVDPSFVPTFDDSNPTRQLRYPRLTRWLIFFGEKSPYAVSRWVPAQILEPGRRTLRTLLQKKGPLTPLQPDLIVTLRNRFRPEVVRLAEFLGVDLCSKWGYDS